MKDESFNSLWATVHMLFGTAPPTDGRKTLCKRKVSHIPDIAVPWIAKQFELMESKPRNLTAALIDLWGKWQERTNKQTKTWQNKQPYSNSNSIGSRMRELRTQGMKFTEAFDTAANEHRKKQGSDPIYPNWSRFKTNRG